MHGAKKHRMCKNPSYCLSVISTWQSLFVCVCVCETWSLTLREERRHMVFENRVLGRIFGPKRD